MASTKTKNKTPKKICVSDKCEKAGIEQSLNNFYKSFMTEVFTDGHIPLCKKCCQKLFNEQGFKGFQMVMKMIDKPIYEKHFKGDYGKYIRLLNSFSAIQYEGTTYEDSDLFEESKSTIKNKKIKAEELTEDKIEELIDFFGDNNYDEKDLIFLENFYSEYENTYATDTPVQINLYKNIAKVHLQAEKALANGDIKNFKDLMDLSSKLHNDGNIKPIQNTGANEDRGLSTYGLWIKEIEREEPCEYFEDKPLYEDYDKFKNYWEKWFVRPFKNIFNISKDFNVRNDD